MIRNPVWTFKKADFEEIVVFSFTPTFSFLAFSTFNYFTSPLIIWFTLATQSLNKPHEIKAISSL